MRTRRSRSRYTLAIAFLLLQASASTSSQAQTDAAPQDANSAAHALPERTYQLSHTGDPKYADEVVTLMRNCLDPGSTVRLETGGQELVVTANAEQMKLAEKLLDDIDSVRPPQSEQKASEVFQTTRKRPASDSTDAAELMQQTYYLPNISDLTPFLRKLRAAIPSTMRLYYAEAVHAIVAEGSATDLDTLKDALRTLQPGWSPVEDGAASEVFTIPAASSENLVEEQTFYLPETKLPSFDIEALVSVRNLVDPHAKIYLVPSQHAIVVIGTDPELKLAQKVVTDLDVKTATE